LGSDAGCSGTEKESQAHLSEGDVCSVIWLPSLLPDDGMHQLCTALPGPIIAYLTGKVRPAAPRERTVGACDETLLGQT
jgi:hypothetical protein